MQVLIPPYEFHITANPFLIAPHWRVKHGRSSDLQPFIDMVATALPQHSHSGLPSSPKSPDLTIARRLRPSTTPPITNIASTPTMLCLFASTRGILRPSNSNGRSRSLNEISAVNKFSLQLFLAVPSKPPISGSHAPRPPPPAAFAAAAYCCFAPRTFLPEPGGGSRLLSLPTLAPCSLRAPVESTRWMGPTIRDLVVARDTCGVTTSSHPF